MSSLENLPPHIMRTIAREVRLLATKPPAGIKFVPNPDENIAEIYAELQGPADTPYEGGTFLVKLVIGRDFPAAPPKGYFLTKIYHPNVAQDSGEICVNTLKKDWKDDVGLGRILKVIWCLLVVPFPESSLNDEAGKLFMDSYDDYAKKARLLTKIHALKKSGPSNSTKESEKCQGRRKVPKGGINTHFPSKKRATGKKDKGSRTKANTKRPKDRRQVTRKKSLKRL